MPNPISRQQYDAVYELLHPGEQRERLKQKDIAERTGVSERTIRSIKTGDIARPPEPIVESCPTEPRMHDDIEFKLTAPYRCPTCGLVITLKPCLYCHHKAKGKQQS